MMARLLFTLWLAGVALASFSAPTSAQSAGSGGSQSGFTLQTNARVVLTDVTVTDQKGRPVHGLKASDFRIFDNEKPQEVASFEEHRKGDRTPAPLPAAAPGVYSNDYIAHPPDVLNVVLIDITNLSIEDQMYLNYQLGKFLNALKPDEPIALYARTGPACILLQGFTSDRELLRAAVRRLLPRFPPQGRRYLKDFEALRQIELYLTQIPGRKNVLWFGGGSVLGIRPDATRLNNYQQWQTVYDELEANRIAVYPIDARGLTVYGGSDLIAQHGVMSDVAEATGGRAVYDSNGLALAASQIVQDDGEYYTLTYAPHPFAYDNKWHKVQVTLPGAYSTLRYRRGYFADGTRPLEPRPKRSRTRLLSSGATIDELPIDRDPILFQAKLLEGAVADADTATGQEKPTAPRGTTPFHIRFSMPLDAFTMKREKDRWNVECGAAILAFNENGSLVAKKAQKTTFTLLDEAAEQPAGKRLPLDEGIDLPKGDMYLYVAVWDMRSRRMGTLEIPQHVDRVARPGVAHPAR